MPLLTGIFASAISGHLTPADAGSMVPLSVFTLSSAQADVTFTNIPQTYTHLQIRVLARHATGSSTNASNQVRIQFNGDTGANYSIHRLWGDGSSANADGYANTSNGLANGVAGSSTTANVFSAGIIDILDYRQGNKYPTTRSIMGTDLNGSGSIWITSSSWRNTAAITSIRLFDTFSYAANSSFALYGIKGA